MEMKHLMMLPLLLATAPVMAQDYYQPGGTQQTACYETVYREEYVPGTKDNTGYVRTFRERVAVPCEDETPIRQSNAPRRQNEDTNSCIEGSVIGGLLGGGIGGAISRDSGRWIAVPTGAVLGGLIGCQVDGG